MLSLSNKSITFYERLAHKSPVVITKGFFYVLSLTCSKMCVLNYKILEVPYKIAYAFIENT